MASISLKDVHLEFPVFEQHSRSLKRELISLAATAEIRANNRGVTIVKALADISLELSDGARLAILGGNGAGKTTLLRIMSAIYQPTQGSCVVEGNIVSIFDLSLGFDDDGTGYDNIFLRAILMGFKRSEIHGYIDEIIDFSELGEYIFMPLRTYSAGMKLRLAFSITSVLKPQILLMDEWLAVGDQQFMQKAQARVQELLEQTSILVLASHDVNLVRAICNRGIIIENGKIQFCGAIEETLARYQNIANP